MAYDLKRLLFYLLLRCSVGDIQKIEIYPFNLIFFLKSKKKRLILRFSTTYQETNEKVKK